jgi:hypothetical protein
VGIFYNWGGWDNLGWFDYLTTNTLEALGTENLYEKWRSRPSARSYSTNPYKNSTSGMIQKIFMLRFEL